MSISQAPRIGRAGTGVLGSAMRGHPLDAGYSAIVFDRAGERANGLIAKGTDRPTGEEPA